MKDHYTPNCNFIIPSSVPKKKTGIFPSNTPVKNIIHTNVSLPQPIFHPLHQ